MTAKHEYFKKLRCAIDGVRVGDYAARHEYPGFIQIQASGTISLNATPGWEDDDENVLAVEMLNDADGTLVDEEDPATEIPVSWTYDVDRDIEIWKNAIENFMKERGL